MAEATPILRPPPSAVIGTLARQTALKAVKKEVRAKGPQALPLRRTRANQLLDLGKCQMLPRSQRGVGQPERDCSVRC
jgi:hypothetical protein